MITEAELRVLREKFEPVRQGKQPRYRELEKLQEEFVSRFPPSRIPLLSLDDYVVGKGSKDSFCYWVNWKTDALGSIESPNLSKFGVFFDKATKRYKFKKIFENENDAMMSLRKQIVLLLEAGRANNLEVIEASHIKGWADSNDNERLDWHNGLLLTANLHKLFDAGLISFEDSGKILVSSKLSQAEQEIFGVIGKKLSKKPSAETANYLACHRNKFLV